VVLGGEDVVHNNFSQSLPNSISGTVRVAPLGTGEPTDAPKAGVPITLYDKNGNLIASTTSASDGTYSFNNLGPGTYTVKEGVPSSYYAINDVVGSQGGTAPNLTTLANIVLTSNQKGVRYDFYLQQPVTLAGTVLVSPQGTHDPNSTPLGGVTIQLLDANGNVLATTTTAADGTYQFPSGTLLKPGSYTVHELVPNGYYATYDSIGSNGGTATDLQTLANITLASGQNGVKYDFWLQQPTSVSGYVHSDIYGCWTPTENQNAPPVAGVTIQILDDGGKVIGTTTTDAYGHYQFQTLPPGTYSVHELLPAGWFLGPSHVGSVGGNTSNGDLLTAITLTSGTNGLYYDFCLTPPASISGYVQSDIYG
jgi:protocatechuate 3,4-dioxygenase beta subunit